MAHTDNHTVIDAPIAYVWAKTNDLAGWTGLFTEYDKVEVLTEEEDRFTFRLTTRPDESGRSWSWVSERVLDRPSWTVTRLVLDRARATLVARH